MSRSGSFTRTRIAWHRGQKIIQPGFVGQTSMLQSRNFHQMKKTTKSTDTPAPTAAQETEFRLAASFLYLADIMDRFCALLSSSVKKSLVWGKMNSAWTVKTQLSTYGMGEFNFSCHVPDRTAPLCRTSSMFCTMIRWTSCNSVLSALKFRRPLLSAYVFLAFWM